MAPAQPDAQRLQAGSVIEPARVSTEIDTVFASLASVLNSVHPAKIAATLGAISTALNGQGTSVGHFIVQLNSYLRQFNPSLPVLGRDFALAPSVASAYASAAPDLIATLDNLRVTSGTLTSDQAQFDAFLVNLSGFAGTTQNFLASNETGLTRTLATLLPTTQLLADYSPEIPCTLAGMEQINAMDNSNEIQLNTSIVPGHEPYTNPNNLPQIGATNGPSCYGGPLTRADAGSWHGMTFNDGTNGATADSGGSLALGNPPLAIQLFGSDANAAIAAAKNLKKKG
jgi:phospholipid/cholesterol/gamma-HCH transport system substrate-binding protein